MDELEEGLEDEIDEETAQQII